MVNLFLEMKVLEATNDDEVKFFSDRGLKKDTVEMFELWQLF